ncbi:MAG: HNH endonuclease [Actinomycetota bacterium]|nr:HNH endonuclease [Actinomycetota bacterium]
MKRTALPRRSAPLARTGELTRRTPLARTPLVPAPRRATGPSRPVRDLVEARAGGRCERCGITLAGTWPPPALHHRRPRALGGTSDAGSNLPANLLLLCAACHAHVESHRILAYQVGWLVLQGHVPSAVPVLRRNVAVLLDNQGGYVQLLCGRGR